MAPEDLIGPHELAVQAHQKLLARLSESEARYRELVELQADVIFRCDKDGILRYVSPAVRNMLGFEPSSWEGHLLAEFLFEAEPPDREDLEGCLRGKARRRDGRFRFRTAKGRARWLHCSARLDPDAGPVGLLRDVHEMVVHEDERARLNATLIERTAQLHIRDQRRAEDAEALAYRYRLQAILTRISSSFLHQSVGDVDALVEQGLGEIGSFLGTDRAYIFLLAEDGALMSNTHEWCAPGISAEKGNLQDLPVALFPWWIAELEAARSINVPTVAELPPEAAAEKEILEAQGIQSLVVVPLRLSGRLAGFAGFDAVRVERTWDADVVDLLRLVGDILIGAIDRTRSEALRLESGRKYRLLADNAMDLIWRTDLQFRCEYVNPACERILGLPAGAVQGRDIRELCEARTRPKMQEWLDAGLSVDPKDAVLTITQRLRRPDGGWIPVETTASFFLDDQGQAVGIQGTSRDISDRVTASAALQESKQRLGLVIQGIQEGILMVDQGGFVRVANPAAAIQLNSADSGPVEGRELSSLLMGLKGGPALLAELEAGRAASSCEIETGGEASRTLKVSCSPYRDPEGLVTGSLLLMSDVTREREVDRMKSEFVASVSHELRTPLTSILGFTRTLLRKPGLDEATRGEFLTIIHEQSVRLHTLIEDILEISRVESQGREVHLAPHCLRQAIREVLLGLSSKARQGGVTLVPDLPAAPERLILQADPVRLRSLIENLVENAIKFTPRGGRITVRVSPQEGFYLLEVEDTGLGIPEEDLPKIFERFHRVHRPGLEIPGTGLGLAIVREIVAAHGGSIEVQSQPGQGTTFKVLLPRSSS